MNINTARKTAKALGCVLMTLDDDGMYYLKVACGHSAWKPDQKVQDFAAGELRRMSLEAFKGEIKKLLTA